MAFAMGHSVETKTSATNCPRGPASARTAVPSKRLCGDGSTAEALVMVLEISLSVAPETTAACTEESVFAVGETDVVRESEAQPNTQSKLVRAMKRNQCSAIPLQRGSDVRVNRSMPRGRSPDRMRPLIHLDRGPSRRRHPSCQGRRPDQRRSRHRRRRCRAMAVEQPR